MSKTVCIDARMVRASGIGTYVQGLLQGMTDLNTHEVSLTLLGDPTKLPSGKWTILPVRTPIYTTREQVTIPLAFKYSKACLLHSPHYNLPFLSASQTVVTVHDLIHLIFPQFLASRAARVYAHAFFHWVVPRARAILTDSEHTRQDLIALLHIPETRITVTPLAVSKRYSPDAARQPDFSALQLPEVYFLYVGNLKEFKNVRFLLDVYRRFCAKHRDSPPLVIVGRNFIPGFDREIQSTPHVKWLNEIDFTWLPMVYARAFVFLFPSLYEGFGLPPLEAMASGVPVLCSNRTSLPEVTGDAALLCDPTRPEEWVDGMERLSQDASLRKQLSEKGLRRAATFPWTKTAKLTLEVYKKCLG